MSTEKKSFLTKSIFKKYSNPEGIDFSKIPTILETIPIEGGSIIKPIDNNILAQNGDNFITQNNEYLSLQ
tara:strand:+ start:384 stop:593 length:210 start_codon:yes stop_codon:yes gene_type:complete